jgi:hypothetical protein
MQASELLTRIQLRARIDALMERSAEAPSGLAIVEECLALAEMLVEKNTKYGDSALDPIRVFSKADPVEQIRVRIDDKLNRLMKGVGVEDEDTVSDLIGYLVLLRIAARRNVQEKVQAYSPYLSDAPSEAQQATEAKFAHWWRVKGVVPAPVEELTEVKQPLTVFPEEYGIQPIADARCQDCGKGRVQPHEAICDACYERRYGRGKVDLSHVQG